MVCLAKCTVEIRKSTMPGNLSDIVPVLRYSPEPFARSVDRADESGSRRLRHVIDDSRLRCKPLRSSLKTPEESTSRPRRRSCRIHRFATQCALSFLSSCFLFLRSLLVSLAKVVYFSFSNRLVLSRLAARSSSLRRPVTLVSPRRRFRSFDHRVFYSSPFLFSIRIFIKLQTENGTRLLGIFSLFLVCRCRPVILDTQ